MKEEKIMKKITFYLMILAFSWGMTACNSKKEPREQQVQEFRSQLTAEDTATMLKLCDDAMEELKARKIDKVLASLYEYTDSTQDLRPLSKETEKRYRRQFTMFPVKIDGEWKLCVKTADEEIDKTMH